MKHAMSMPSMRGKHHENSALQETPPEAGVEVFVRLRPLVERELKLGSEIKWKYNKAILEDTGSGTKTNFDGDCLLIQLMPSV